MAFLDEAQLQRLQIRRMVFHVVGPRDADLVLLEELNPVVHAEFFLDRVRATNNGNRFRFVRGSATCASLRHIAADPGRFAEESRQLATRFQRGHGGNTAKGVFLLLQLETGGVQYFSVIKYDHETVLHYLVERGHVTLEQIRDAFVRTPEALQKCALIQLVDDGGELCVVDRSNRAHISRYFQVFLEVDREFSTEQLTERLVEAAKTVGTQHRDDLPLAIRRNLHARIYDAVQQQGAFDSHDAAPFLTAVFGPLPPDSPIGRSFARELRSQRIEGEAFHLAPDAVRRPAKRHTVTSEGIEIIFNDENRDHIERVQENGETIIKIRTGGIEIDGDYVTERNPRRR
jgi:hypothetical protein